MVGKRVVFLLIVIILSVAFFAGNAHAEASYYPFLDRDHIGLIDEKGELVIEPIYLEMGQPSDGWIAVRESSQWKYRLLEGSGEIKGAFDQAGPFVDGIAPVSLGDLNGFIDQSGEWLASGFAFVDAYSEGFAVVGDQSGIYFLDDQMKDTFKKRFEDAGSFSYGLAPIRLQEKWGLINSKGMIAVDPFFDDIPALGQESIVGKANGKYGMLNRDGGEVIPFEYEMLLPLTEGMIGYFDGEFWGYMNIDQEIVIPCRFSNITPFSNQRAYVIESGVGKVIDQSGQLIGNLTFEAFNLEDLLFASQYSYQFYEEMKAPFSNHQKMILDGNAWKIINDQGEILFQ